MEHYLALKEFNKLQKRPTIAISRKKGEEPFPDNVLF